MDLRQPRQLLCWPPCQRVGRPSECRQCRRTLPVLCTNLHVSACAQVCAHLVGSDASCTASAHALVDAAKAACHYAGTSNLY
eukprot:scaffold152962_cov22-Tisochrysis_lutea.AAC.1